MARITIAPSAVREAGLICIHAADDLQAQSVALRSVIMPPMPAGMAAEHSSAIGAVAARLANVVQSLERAGAELQLRADAADLADGGTNPASMSAGSQLANSVITSTVLLTGGAQQISTITVRPGGSVTAVGGPSGLRVTIPELVRTDGSDVMRTPAAEPPDPHVTAQKSDPSSREIEPASSVGGAPAAAVQQAVSGGGGGGGGGGNALTGAASADGLGSTITAGDQVDPSAANPGLHAAGHEQTGIPVPTDLPDDHDARRQDWACWIAGSAAHDGVPPALPVMLALAGSGMRNLPAGGHQAGLFGIDPRRSYAPPGHGLPSDAQPSADWWADHPDAQLDEVVSRLRGASGGIRDLDLDDPGALSRWASDALPSVDAQSLDGAHEAAAALISHCKHTGGAAAGGGAGAGSAGGGSALKVAQGQLGVHEVGTNAGPKVNEYLRSAGVGSGNPWCASFVTWALEQTGHDMPGQGWAAVTNWVQAASNGQHGLQLVDAAHARPGDIVAYDWGHDGDFGSDGHIGFLDSKVDASGHFTAVEGNAQDAVTRMDRNLGMAKIVFIRAGA